ncbi:hypothetical protein E3T55_14660 [Cryobacterium frigoriphilum]|uniref:Alpha/beta hydrolase n=1 Tax=Cryobacterium frigoriphilum TaxID=1259150 RepID=A0A4R8ZWC5_9MICO|nr:hypothetical protein [Cryobacterium frigoriphilum]TFD47794.1 hypothetical protein E3T55_14660 [Cryobacterium frigoriphilum]
MSGHDTEIGRASGAFADGGAHGAPVTVGGPGGVGGGPLMVSGGGSTKVATGELFAESAVLRRAEADAENWLGQLGSIRSLQPLSSSGCTYVGTAELSAAAEAISAVREEAADLAAALDRAAENYGATEGDIERLLRSLGADAGWWFGLTSHVWLPLVAGPALAGIAISGLLASMITGTPLNELPAEVLKYVADHPEIYTDPAFVELVAVLVASVDDAVAGRIGIPHWLSRLLGDDQLGILGASTSAAGVTLLLRNAGIGRSTAITVKQAAEPKPVQPPAGFAQASARIPPSVAGTPQILIERYAGPDGPVWFVYVGGTVDWSVFPGMEPFDMSSNLQGVGQLQPASREAVELAMLEAGIQKGDTVQIFGHSQGGLIVAQVAEAGKFGIDGVTTFGAPSGQVDVTVSTMAFENSDDAVVATGGRAEQPSPDRLVVGHQAYLDKEIPKGQGLPAHQLAAYTDTAGLADASEDPRVRAKKEARFGLELGAGTAVLWRADRVEEGRSAHEAGVAGGGGRRGGGGRM